MISQSAFRTRAVEMAERHARYLLDSSTRLDAETSLPQAVGLIRDCVLHLDRPALAIDLALGFHRRVEHWSAWPAWAEALDLVLAIDPRYNTGATKIRLLNSRSQAARSLGEYGTAVETSTEALRLAEARLDNQLIAESHNCIGMIAFLRDDSPWHARISSRRTAVGSDICRHAN
jgi:cell division inhibitor SulA